MGRDSAMSAVFIIGERCIFWIRMYKEGEREERELDTIAF